MASGLPYEIKLMIFEEYINSFKGKVIHITEHHNELADALKPLFVSRDIRKLGQDKIFELVVISGGFAPVGYPYTLFYEPSLALGMSVQHYEMQIEEQPKQIDLARLDNILMNIREVGHYFPNLRSIHINFLYASTKPILSVARSRLGEAGRRFEVLTTMEEVIRQLQRVFEYRQRIFGYGRIGQQPKVEMSITDSVFNQKKADLFLWGEGLGSPALRGIRMRIPFDNYLDELANVSEARWATAEQGWRTLSSRPYPPRF